MSYSVFIGKPEKVRLSPSEPFKLNGDGSTASACHPAAQARPGRRLDDGEREPSGGSAEAGPAATNGIDDGEPERGARMLRPLELDRAMKVGRRPRGFLPWH